MEPDRAFEITQKFVAEYLGDAYEAVFVVHDNTDHVHSHIVFNSVSFVDGKKYRYEKGDWAKYIQPITNKLCQEYGLSIIDVEDGSKEKQHENYVKSLVAQMDEVVEKINHQNERYDALNKKLSEIETSKDDEEVRERLVKENQDKDALINSQQNELNKASSTIARLRDDIEKKDKEIKRMGDRIESLEDKIISVATENKKEAESKAEPQESQSVPQAEKKMVDTVAVPQNMQAVASRTRKTDILVKKKDDTATNHYACNGKYKLPCSKSHCNRFLIAVNILVYFDYHCPCLLS